MGSHRHLNHAEPPHPRLLDILIPASYIGHSPGNKYFLMDKNVNKGFSTEFDSVGPSENTHKTPPESSLGKSRFRVKSKMVTIEPVICVFFSINHYHLGTKHRTATYNMSFGTNILNDSIY